MQVEQTVDEAHIEGEYPEHGFLNQHVEGLNEAGVQAGLDATLLPLEGGPVRVAGLLSKSLGLVLEEDGTVRFRDAEGDDQQADESEDRKDPVDPRPVYLLCLDNTSNQWSQRRACKGADHENCGQRRQGRAGREGGREEEEVRQLF